MAIPIRLLGGVSENVHLRLLTIGVSPHENSDEVTVGSGV